ncbi:hypothetical protein KIPB_015178, partial [Kipferlia bialata]
HSQSAMPCVFKVGTHIHVLKAIKGAPAQVHVYDTDAKKWRRGEDVPVEHGNISVGAITRYRVLFQNENEMIEGEMVGERERERLEKERMLLAASLASLGMPPDDIAAAPLSDPLTPLLRDRLESLEYDVAASRSRLVSVGAALQRTERDVELLSSPTVHKEEALRLLSEYQATDSVDKEIRLLTCECRIKGREIRREKDDAAKAVVEEALAAKQRRLDSLQTRVQGRADLRAELEGYVVYPEVERA